MSHRRQSKQPVRRVQSGSRALSADAPNAAGQDRYAGTNDQDDVDYTDGRDYDEYRGLSEQGGDYEEQYEEQYEEPLPGRRGLAARDAGADGGAYGRRGASTGPGTRRYAVAPPPRRDYFPYVMGALVGALVVGLMAVAYLLGTGASTATRSGGPVSSGAQSGQSGQSLPTAPAAGGQAASEPPRISMGDFKALYDDPAARPMIIDVRTRQVYDEGHIKGAVSFPEGEVDARISELPKDRLIVAYCQ